MRSAGEDPATYYTTQVLVSGSSMDISSNLAAAPAPPSSAGVPSVNGITAAVTVAAGASTHVTTVGDTITIAGNNPDQGNAVASGSFSTVVLGSAPVADSVGISINGLLLNPGTDYTLGGTGNRTATLTTPGVITNVVVATWITASASSGSIALA